MNKKMIVFFVVLLFSLSMVWADNNTTDTLEVEDNGHYILPVSISNGEIKFNDGFNGFNINPDKNKVEMSDKFLLDSFNGKDIENTVKLVIIEAYKQGKENEIGQIISKLNNGDSNDNVIKEALNSNEKIGNNPVVKIDNSTEATFNFEYLKSVDDEKSDCIAYKVSMKTVEEPEILTSPSDDSDNHPVEETDDSDNGKTADDQKQTDDNTVDNQKQSDDNKKSDNNTSNNQKSDDKNESDNDTTVNETNKTIINKTNTVIVNENNTTIINNNNVKTINNTNDTPENNTTSQLLKAAGNPILILIIVIVIIAIVAVALYRKD